MQDSLDSLHGLFAGLVLQIDPIRGVGSRDSSPDFL